MLRLARSGLRAAVVAQSHERADVRPLYTPLTTIKPPLLLVNSPTLFFPLPFLFLERGDPWVSYPHIGDPDYKEHRGGSRLVPAAAFSPPPPLSAALSTQCRTTSFGQFCGTSPRGLLQDLRVRAGTPAHTRSPWPGKLHRVRAGTPAHTCAGSFASHIYVVCVLARRRTRVKIYRLEHQAHLRDQRPRRVISKSLQFFIGRSPGAYLREATVTGAFKRTC